MPLPSAALLSETVFLEPGYASLFKTTGTLVTVKKRLARTFAYRTDCMEMQATVHALALAQHYQPGEMITAEVFKAAHGEKEKLHMEIVKAQGKGTPSAIEQLLDRLTRLQNLIKYELAPGLAELIGKESGKQQMLMSQLRTVFRQIDVIKNNLKAAQDNPRQLSSEALNKSVLQLEKQLNKLGAQAASVPGLKALIQPLMREIKELRQSPLLAKPAPRSSLTLVKSDRQERAGPERAKITSSKTQPDSKVAAAKETAKKRFSVAPTKAVAALEKQVARPAALQGQTAKVLPFVRQQKVARMMPSSLSKIAMAISRIAPSTISQGHNKAVLSKAGDAQKQTAKSRVQIAPVKVTAALAKQAARPAAVLPQISKILPLARARTLPTAIEKISAALSHAAAFPVAASLQRTAATSPQQTNGVAALSGALQSIAAARYSSLAPAKSENAVADGPLISRGGQEAMAALPSIAGSLPETRTATQPMPVLREANMDGEPRGVSVQSKPVAKTPVSDQPNPHILQTTEVKPAEPVVRPTIQENNKPASEASDTTSSKAPPSPPPQEPIKTETQASPLEKIAPVQAAPPEPPRPQENTPPVQSSPPQTMPPNPPPVEQPPQDIAQQQPVEKPQEKTEAAPEPIAPAKPIAVEKTDMAKDLIAAEVRPADQIHPCMDECCKPKSSMPGASDPIIKPEAVTLTSILGNEDKGYKAQGFTLETSNGPAVLQVVAKGPTSVMSMDDLLGDLETKPLPTPDPPLCHKTGRVTCSCGDEAKPTPR